MKNKKTAEYTLDDWQSEIGEIASVSPEKPGPGFFTREQLADHFKVHVGTIVNRTRRGLANGTIEKKSFRVRIADGRCMPISHYRIVKPKK